MALSTLDYGTNKKELMESATTRGIDVSEEMTNENIISKIRAYDKENIQRISSNDQSKIEDHTPDDDLENADEVKNNEPVKQNIEKHDFINRLSKNPNQVSRNRQKKTIEKLKEQATVRFFIPKDPRENETATMEVGINGVVLVYKKGEMYDMPEQVADLVANYLKTLGQAGKEFAIGRGISKTDPESGKTITTEQALG